MVCPSFVAFDEVSHPVFVFCTATYKRVLAAERRMIICTAVYYVSNPLCRVAGLCLFDCCVALFSSLDVTVICVWRCFCHMHELTWCPHWMTAVLSLLQNCLHKHKEERLWKPVGGLSLFALCCWGSRGGCGDPAAI